MGSPFELLEAEVLKLSIAERAQLAEHLIASLDESDEIDSAWADEVGRRLALIDNGQSVAIPFEEAMEQVYAALK